MGIVSNASRQNKANLSCLRSRMKGSILRDKHDYSYVGHLSVHKEISHAAKSRVEMEQDKIFKRDLILILSILVVCMGLLGMILKDI